MYKNNACKIIICKFLAEDFDLDLIEPMRPTQQHSSQFSAETGVLNVPNNAQQQNYMAMQQQHHHLRQQQLQQQNMYQQQQAKQHYLQQQNSSGYASPAPLSVGSSHNAGTPTLQQQLQNQQQQKSTQQQQQFHAQQQQLIRIQQQQATTQKEQQIKRECDKQIKNESDEEDLELLKLPQRSPQKGDSPASPSKIPELQQQNISNSIESVMEKLFGNGKEVSATTTSASRSGYF